MTIKRDRHGCHVGVRDKSIGSLSRERSSRRVTYRMTQFVHNSDAYATLSSAVELDEWKS